MLGRWGGVKFTWLSGIELDHLRPVFVEMGWSSLPESALAYAAFDVDGLAGFITLQLKPHAEPLYVRPDMEGTGLSSLLTAEMAKFLEDTKTQSFMVIADTPEAEKLCERFGMRKVTSPVYVK